MGIYCEIDLYKPENGVYVGRTGTVVSGVIRYSIDEETIVDRITVSLKGMGKLDMEISHGSRAIPYCIKEDYIDIDNVISENKLITGMHEVPFRFEIPQNVPPTLVYKKWRPAKDSVKCNITYYVRIKFTRSGFKNTKRFKKEITVIPCIIPRLSTTPIIHAGQKKLSQLFSLKSRIVNVKANILNSVLKAGHKITLSYEVVNDTNLVIRSVETKLVEVYKFYLKHLEMAKHERDIPETDSKIGEIRIGQTRQISVEINIPPDIESAEFSKLFSRDYYIFITAFLPAPHRNHVLEIPVQIGKIFVANALEATCSHFEDEKPPSYWEAMHEYTTDKI